MAEWWNLDQTLIWMLTRDPELVGRAGGDAKGARPRKAYFFGELDWPENSEAQEDPEHDEEGETPSASLIRHLADGDFEARDVGQNPPPPVMEAIFREYDCVVKEHGEPVMLLRTAAVPTAAAPFCWMYINIKADTVREHYPPKAPAAMQDELAKLLDASPKNATPQSVPRSPSKLTKEERAKQALASLYPEGLASPDEAHGKQRSQILRVIRHVRDTDRVEISERVVRRAAGLG